ncbi:EndoU domain-containing protein [Aureibaculum sp. A20]|uniref:EndoU domain-containing protein n=1 Tax=Aureibaculum flavum TaxID=2795986 RepID=A0ABS0WP59_9FLAO|nr:EndoU domain-containing protein [Aureibaculum flavum]MBJ2173777.1 EndoU domain-containing protein [Aureibaculum flavum]
MDYYYYILKNSFSTDKQSLKTGVIIHKVPTTYPFDFINGNGPFKDLKELKRKSTIYRNLILRNPKRAEQICVEKNMRVIKAVVLAKKGLRVNLDFIEIIEHCTKGRVNRGKVSGIHFYDPKTVKILNIIDQNPSNGIWEAQIEYFDSRTKKWIKKDTSTTFFPNDWSYHQLFHECLFAVNNKIKKKNSKNIYTSKTESGIEVEIICLNGAMKSIYPVLKQ